MMYLDWNPCFLAQSPPSSATMNLWWTSRPQWLHPLVNPHALRVGNTQSGPSYSFVLDALPLSGPLAFLGDRNQDWFSAVFNWDSNPGATQYRVCCSPHSDFTFQRETCGPAVCAAAHQKYWAWHLSHFLTLHPPSVGRIQKGALKNKSASLENVCLKSQQYYWQLVSGDKEEPQNLLVPHYKPVALYFSSYFILITTHWSST